MYFEGTVKLKDGNNGKLSVSNWMKSRSSMFLDGSMASALKYICTRRPVVGMTLSIILVHLCVN